ncbi:DnaJ-domain-containing protein [Schizopora paradoxa]|uniref:DnaJ-domain-containing protein n=1 Tax=Schizopora paradoxa TaxID=27342 RepID=A0A0H2RTG9_9AGAM|nr:DnaJ-domain-containing protein [Schizopora paradoxa]
MSTSSTLERESGNGTTHKDTKNEQAELERLLNREATAFNRELEVDRILKAFKLNPYEILDVDVTITPDGVKKRYKQLSLFIHPDKTSHPSAPIAFDLLKKAKLSNSSSREELDATLVSARQQLLKSLSLPTSIVDSDHRLTGLKPPFKEQLRDAQKKMLIDEEVRRRKAVKLNHANEGYEARKKEDEVNEKKRKAEADKDWEANREVRVGSWRDFAGSKKKKAKTKSNILG